MFAFGDSFDLYTNAADVSPGFWDTYAAGSGPFVAQPGRFAGGRSWGPASNWSFSKSSGQNDAVHHINLAFIFTSAISGTTQGTYFTFRDGATAQATVAIRSDGALQLYSGSNGGTLLDTYPLNPVVNQWFVFEVEVVINNTTGSWTIKKSGNTGTADHTLGSLNTRAGTTNNYANALIVGMGGGFGNFNFDDLLWRSDPTAVPWAGDIRSYTRMPASDQQKQFTPNLTSTTQNINTAATTSGGGFSIYSIFNPQIDGQLTSVGVSMNTAYTGNVKVALFSTNASNNPGTVIASAANLVNPAVGFNTTTFASPPTVMRGTQYFIGTMPDGSATFNAGSASTLGRYTNSTTNPSYAAFPQANPQIYGNSNPIVLQATLTAVDNFSFVNEAQQDGTTTYVFDSTAGDADLYGIASIPTSPASTVCVTTRAFMQKSDAGTRSSAVQLKSGSTTVASPSTPMTTGFSWNYRTDLTDPATGAAWTATGVNNVQIGPTVTV